jgi:predicted HicB family RNase H-like nuclease
MLSIVTNVTNISKIKGVDQMNKVKVFPIRMSAEFHKQLAMTAMNEYKSIHQFILDAIEKELKNNENKSK